ncbi:1,2-phenylacetyl-CoA epoxidase subunit PaaC [Thermaerobacter subterraneus]|uniref:Phenylacetate-CoA oxygenase, PaaI subunit n=1 Tax=Thermaerobacter subterraneus DSM 13965 TaxID=867903 RepID=K6QE35_9FIRM|nr:1,2-phenylacetyl-CoA epoxidase subunit PaaC [Thermaerobacter subterraneus]EKP95011.1 phenylacetate-CoA oxygenase, PaaI subunit [Thermaerobacter subterraneus DSM 13965]
MKGSNRAHAMEPLPAHPAGAAAAGADPGLVALLFALADDELIAGHRASEWTGVAPYQEEDVAFSSIAQDEVGHSALLYQLLADLGQGGGDPDALAFGRDPADFRNAILLEQPNGDWAAEIARHFLYSEYEAVLWPALARSPYEPLAAAAARVAREEAYHQAHFRQWVVELGRAGGEARERLAPALTRALALAAGFFEPVEGEEQAARWRGASLEELRRLWWAAVRQVLEEAGLAEPVLGQPGPGEPAGVEPADPGMGGGPAAAGIERGLGGRRGHHSPALETLLAEMTLVYRSDPAAEW